MAMSGVTLADNVVSAMNDVRMKRSRYAVLRIDETGKIAVVEEGTRDQTFTDFVGKYSTDEPCYAAFDYEYEDGGVTRDKVLLIQWIPDTAKARAKMVYSSSRDALNSVSEGFLPIQANDASELEKDEIIRKVKGSRTR